MYFAVFSDADFAEEDLVQESAPEVACGQIGLQGLLCERERVSESLVDVGELDLGASQKLIEGLLLRFDSLGLATHHVLGHTALEVQFKELGLVVFECLEASAVPDGCSLDDRYMLSSYRLDCCTDLSDSLLG
ncbi:MAG: hypothetical protein ACYDHN_14980 [Solirubrobacteraceae bacterium]